MHLLVSFDGASLATYPLVGFDGAPLVMYPLVGFDDASLSMCPSVAFSFHTQGYVSKGRRLLSDASIETIDDGSSSRTKGRIYEATGGRVSYHKYKVLGVPSKKK